MVYYFLDEEWLHLRDFLFARYIQYLKMFDAPYQAMLSAQSQTTLPFLEVF